MDRKVVSAFAAGAFAAWATTMAFSKREASSCDKPVANNQQVATNQAPSAEPAPLVSTIAKNQPAEDANFSAGTSEETPASKAPALDEDNVQSRYSSLSEQTNDSTSTLALGGARAEHLQRILANDLGIQAVGDIHSVSCEKFVCVVDATSRGDDGALQTALMKVAEKNPWLANKLRTELPGDQSGVVRVTLYWDWDALDAGSQVSSKK